MHQPRMLYAHALNGHEFHGMAVLLRESGWMRQIRASVQKPVRHGTVELTCEMVSKKDR
ncbi:MAG: hypothetical protein OXE41_04575 [Gammaproteobacteria bacterium]|nr:hypothetical protein [Gammaproteobacteria bacterium]MCY4274656.1 hypothetical protein [Gammaproteobacteria bacterium]